jgi:hypothetical protein
MGNAWKELYSEYIIEWLGAMKCLRYQGNIVARHLGEEMKMLV